MLINNIKHVSYIDPSRYRTGFDGISHIVSCLQHSLCSIHSVLPRSVLFGGAVVVHSFAVRFIGEPLSLP